MRFIIETNVNEACERLAVAAKNAGHEVVRWDAGDPVPDSGDVFFGSLNAYGTDMPGLLGSPENLKVQTWLGNRGVLNKEAIFAKVNDLPTVEWDEVFVRPNSPLKQFSGRVLPSKNLTPEALDFGFYFNDPRLTVVISPVQEIEEEWRFVAVGGELVASSGYDKDRATLDAVPPPDAVYTAMTALQQSPEEDVVIDIAKVKDGSFKLVEYNLLSGSDLYGCNVSGIVHALASKMAA